MPDIQEASSLPKKRGNPEWVKGVAQRYPKMQEPGPRLKLLVENHGADVVLKAMKDEKFLAEKFSVMDGMHIISLAKALKGDHQAYEHALNRMFGKVPDKAVNINLNIDADPAQLSEKANAMLGNLAGFDDDGSDLVES